MAKNTIAYYTKSGRVTTANATHSGPTVTVFTAGAEGSKILGIDLITYGFTTTGTILVYFNDGVDNTILRLFSSDIASTDIFSYMSLPKTSAGSKYMNIEAGTTIKIAVVVGSGAGSAQISVYGEDY